MENRITDILTSYVETFHPIIYINNYDFDVIDNAIRKISEKGNCLEFNNALGMIDFNSKCPLNPLGEEYSLEQFLKEVIDEGFSSRPMYIVLKDIHDELNSAKVISLLKRIAQNYLYDDEYNLVVFIISAIKIIPKELEDYITLIDIPLPDETEIIEILNNFIMDNSVDVEQSVVDDLALSFKGLNEFQINQILRLAYYDGACINMQDKKLILKEKEQIIKKTGILEIVNYKDDLESVGGLENLKEWLKRKAIVFEKLDKAIKYGVDVPKGVMIVGMPGCGKSLTAKATASLFNVPLVRLDIGRLLGKYVGESEENMRIALGLSEAISPCVLWIDEIEKAFVGIGSDSGGNEVTTRLFGQFLTWMQEKKNTVFIVATANDISSMPPEFLRKGRFDEIFFVNLPTHEERKKIFEIHLKKRKKISNRIDLEKLAEVTKGFNGADIEASVKDCIEMAFIEGKDSINTDDLIKAIKDTKSISSTLKEKIDKILSTIKKLISKMQVEGESSNMNKDYDEILLVDEEDGPILIESECKEFKPILESFIRNYESSDKNNDNWIHKEMKQQLPNKSDEEIDSIIDEIKTTIRINDEKKASLEDAISHGRSKENWFAAEAKKVTSAMSAYEAAKYLKGLDDALERANDSLYRTITTKAGTISQNPCLDGYIAEQYHAQTFNLNAEATGSPYRAKVLNNNTKNSVDIVIVDGEGKVVKRYQSKYCKDSESTKKAFKEGDYRGQRKIVPEDQKEDIKNAADVIEAPDGTKSNPLSKEKAKQLRDEAQSGNWNDLNWNEYATKDLAIGIAKQAEHAAFQGAIIGVGIYIAQKLYEGEKIEPDEIAKTAIESGADFGFKAAVAGAIKVGIEKGIITVIPKGTPMGTITNIAIIAVENAKIMWKMATGELSMIEGLDKIAETTVATACGLIAMEKCAAVGASMGTVFGPVGVAIGGFIGGIIGYMAGSKIGENIVECSKRIEKKGVKFLNNAVNTGKRFSKSIEKQSKKLFRGFRHAFV